MYINCSYLLKSKVITIFKLFVYNIDIKKYSYFGTNGDKLGREYKNLKFILCDQILSLQYLY